MPIARRKFFKRTGRKMNQYKSGYGSSGLSGFANAVKTGIAMAGMTAGGRKIANRLMNLRKRAQSMTKTITRRKTTMGTHVVNHTEKKRLTNLAKPRTAVGNALQLVRASAQYTMYKWNGMKEFDNHGYYWLDNRSLDGTTRQLPCYLFDLTACRNSVLAGTLAAQPLVQVHAGVNGQIFFNLRSGLQADGVTPSTGLQLETAPSSSVSVFHPHARDLLKWVSVKMNCWGCKNRSTKFIIQIVRFTDEDVVPTHANEDSLTSAAITTERTSFFQNMLKPLVYNPIATTSALHNKKMQVYKTESFIIDSTQTTETDADPNVKSLKWFVNLNRICNYVEASNTLTTVPDFVDRAAYAANNQNQQYTAQQHGTSRLYLLIRASNYGQDAESNNADTPSFDLTVGMKHVNFN